jgi:hypothetical protein
VIAGMSRAATNAVRFDPARRRGHVESYFLKANDPTQSRALWIKATIFASTTEPDRAMAEGWAIAFERTRDERRIIAVKHELAYDRADFSAKGLDIRWELPERAEHLAIDGSTTTGAIATRGHRIRWNLRYEGSDRPVIPFPLARMYKASFPRSKILTPLPDARFDGELEVDGRRWTIDGWRGMQGHNWGKGHADLYAWCHANVWDEDREFVLEGMSGRVRVGPVMSPMTTIICVRHRGVAYDFNGPVELLRARGDVELRAWRFSAQSKHARIEGTMQADTEDMVGLYYPNPEGPMTYCLNTKLARGHVRFETNGRAPLELNTRAAALEIGTRDPNHGVRMVV